MRSVAEDLEGRIPGTIQCSEENVQAFFGREPAHEEAVRSDVRLGSYGPGLDEVPDHPHTLVRDPPLAEPLPHELAGHDETFDPLFEPHDEAMGPQNARVRPRLPLGGEATMNDCVQVETRFAPLTG